MKLFEYADNVTLPNGKILDQSDPKSYPFLYFDDKDFFIGDEGSTHMGSLENYFERNDNQEFLDIDPYDYDERDNFLYSYLDNATYTGRVWLNHKVMAFWDLTIDAESRLRLKDIIKKLEKEFIIKIDPKEWWLEFSDTTTGIPYFVILDDFIKGNDLKYGEMESNTEVSSQVRKAWHLLNSAEKMKLKTQYGMDKYKTKNKPLPWKQALLKSESKIIMNIDKFNISLQDMEKTNERISAQMEIPNDILKFYKLFKKNGHKLYIVGGAVRDYLMGKKPHDFDLVTDTNPENIMKILKDYKTDLQGVHFGVVRVFTDDEPQGYEVCSYRKDISKGRNTKGDDKKVEIGKHITIKDDVARRDFSMNALFYDIGTGEIVDVVGGIRDIKDKIIRAVGIPQKRFNEDRLRILRALRFAAVTDSEIDERTSRAIKKDNRLFGISDIDDVSRERIFLDFKKVKETSRKTNNPTITKRFVDMLIEYGIMEQIFPVKILEKSIKPTTYLTVAIAQILRKNEITPEFKQILIDSKIPINFVEIISILIKIWRMGEIKPEDVYELYKEIRNKNVRRDIIEEWIKVMGIKHKSIIKFLDYTPSTSGDEVMKDGFKGISIGNEIRRREGEKFKKMLKESYIIKSFNMYKKDNN
jgi:tRNA nucleotidyltransferase/poly(A) polymerase